MVNKKWIAAGYAAALASIIIVFILLGAAFLTERAENAKRTDSGWTQSAAVADGQTDGNADAAGGEDEAQENFVKEQSETLSDAMDRAEHDAQILLGQDISEAWSLCRNAASHQDLGRRHGV